MMGREIVITASRNVDGGAHLEVEVDGTGARPVWVDDAGEVVASWWGHGATPDDVREACRAHVARTCDQSSAGRSLVDRLAVAIPTLKTRLELIHDGDRVLARVYLGAGPSAFAYRSGSRWRLTSAVPPRWRSHLARAIEDLDTSHGTGGIVPCRREHRERRGA